MKTFDNYSWESARFSRGRCKFWVIIGQISLKLYRFLSGRCKFWVLFPIFLPSILLVDLFERVGLQTNTSIGSSDTPSKTCEFLLPFQFQSNFSSKHYREMQGFFSMRWIFFVMPVNKEFEDAFAADPPPPLCSSSQWMILKMATCWWCVFSNTDAHPFSWPME